MNDGSGPRRRLDPDVFRLPVEKIRSGWYSDAYFNFAKELLEAEGRHAHVTMQVFQKHHAALGGIDEAIALLKLCSGWQSADGGWQSGWQDLDVRALYEGDEIAPYETVLTIAGDYALFAHLETVYLGCLARRTLIMRNVREVVQAARGKQILFFPARHDHCVEPISPRPDIHREREILCCAISIRDPETNRKWNRGEPAQRNLREVITMLLEDGEPTLEGEFVGTQLVTVD